MVATDTATTIAMVITGITTTEHRGDHPGRACRSRGGRGRGDIGADDLG
jgi:hypothetical protein